MTRRGGGRAARVAERSDARVDSPAFIRRVVRPHDLLDDDGLDLIERKADELLGRVGIDINDERDRDEFRRAGARVDGTRVWFEPGQVRELCATAPREFTQHARNPAKSVVIGGDNVVMAPAYGSPFVRDLAGGRRYASLDPDVVVVATGGQPQLPPELERDVDRISTSWDVLTGDVTPTGDVLFFDDNGTHSALSAAEVIARSGARLEIVTPERTFGVEVGGMNHVPYARAFNETDTRITLHQRVLAVRPEGGRLCVELGSNHTSHRSVRHVDHVVVDHGVSALDDLYLELKPLSTNLGAVDYGALRLLKDV